jgi:hypothetical protein
LKRRKDRENEGFLFAKRWAEELDGKTKNGANGKECGSNQLQHFTGWVFPAANFCRV